MADIQGHRNPWHPDLLALNIVQIEFILEMYSIDHPTEMKFIRADRMAKLYQPMMSAVGWADVLRGPALERYMAERTPGGALAEALRRRQRGGRPGRKGRP